MGTAALTVSSDLHTLWARRTLTPLDRFEIAENRQRLGLHDSLAQQCYCTKCVARRNKPKKSFAQEMKERHFRIGVLRTAALLEDVLSFYERIAQHQCPKPDVIKTPARLSHMGSIPSDKPYHPPAFFNYLNDVECESDVVWHKQKNGWEGWLRDQVVSTIRHETSQHAVERGVPVGELVFFEDAPHTDSKMRGGSIQPPSVYTAASLVRSKDGDRRGNRFDFGYLKLSSKQHLSAPPPVIIVNEPQDLPIAQIVYGRPVLPSIGAENRTSQRWNKTFVGDSEIHLPEPTQIPTTFIEVCRCPKSTGWDARGNRKKAHNGFMSAYPDGSVRYECEDRYCQHLSIWGPSPFIASEKGDGIPLTKSLQHKWINKALIAKLKREGLEALDWHAVSEKYRKPKPDTEDTSADMDGAGDGDNPEAPATAAELVGLDWIEDAPLPKEQFKLDDQDFLVIARTFYNTKNRVVTREEMLRDRQFNKAAWAYMIRSRYTQGDQLTEATKKSLQRGVNHMVKLINGECPTGECPSNRCADPNLSLEEREATHAMNRKEWLGKIKGHVGDWFCVVDGYFQFLPDPNKFKGKTEADRVEAAFGELMRQDVMTIARQTRKDGGNITEAKKRRRAAYEAVSYIGQIASETFEA